MTHLVDKMLQWFDLAERAVHYNSPFLFGRGGGGFSLVFVFHCPGLLKSGIGCTCLWTWRDVHFSLLVHGHGDLIDFSVFFSCPPWGSQLNF